MYYDSKLIFDLEYLLDFRLNILNIRKPKEASLNIKGMKVNLKLEDLIMKEKTNVNYRFKIENLILTEIISIQETHGYIELETKLENDEEITMFLDYISPYLGIATYGWLPNANQPSGMTNRIINVIMSEEENINYHINSIYDIKEKETIMNLYTSDNGFYAFTFEYIKSLKIENEKYVKKYYEEKIKHMNTISKVNNVIKKSRIKILIKDLK